MATPPAVKTPHDRLARRVFGRPEAAAIVLRRVLPESLLAWLDLSRISVGSTTFVDPRLGTRQSDLFYSVGIRGSTHHLTVFVALEHQSSPDPMLPLRMFWYVARIWERYVASTTPRPRHIPLVLPIVMVQRGSKWNGPTRLSEMFDLPDTLRRDLAMPIELELWVDDLGESVLDDPVAGPEVLALVELTRALLFGYHHPEALTPERIEQLAPLFDTVLEHDPRDAEALWVYVVSVFAEDSPVRAMLVRAVGKENRAMCATIKEAWFAEGVAEGVAKGMSRGMERGVTRGLATAVLQVLEHRRLWASAAQRQRILATKEESTLERWLNRALTVESIEQVFVLEH